MSKFDMYENVKEQHVLTGAEAERAELQAEARDELKGIISQLTDFGSTFEDVLSGGDEADLGQALAHLEYIEKELRMR